MSRGEKPVVVKGTRILNQPLERLHIVRVRGFDEVEHAPLVGLESGYS